MAMVPRPRLVRADEALARSDRLFARNAYVVSAPVAVTPRLVRAAAAVVAAVPPFAIGKVPVMSAVEMSSASHDAFVPSVFK